MKKKRPFFSIIIPCYNSKPELIKELLQSITNGGCSYEDLEIIIADGRSTDKTFLKEIDSFKKETKISVKIINMPDKTEDGIDLINCPGNTRECGAKEATGQWITFIDHDDLFIKDSFKKIKNKIEEKNIPYVICGNVYHTDPQKDIIIEELKYRANWIHGKFYNLDNFWKKYNFHFKTNLFSNEDIAISAKTNCINSRLVNENEKIFWLDDFVYVWRGWYDSTSNTIYDGQNYMERFFDDYLEATMDIYIDDYNELIKNNTLTKESKDFHQMIQTDAILHQYFYLQSFKFEHINEYKLSYEHKIKKYIKDFYKRFDINADELFYYVDNHWGKGDMYNKIRDSAVFAIGPFIETETFYDFISK